MLDGGLGGTVVLLLVLDEATRGFVGKKGERMGGLQVL